MINKEPRGIREKERNAEKGNIFSIAQLMKNYSTGQFVAAKDDEKSNYYLYQSIPIIKESQFTLTSLELENIKRLTSLTINFHPQLTVLIGENGVGKTTICGSIAKYLNGFTTRITQSIARINKLSDKEITNNVGTGSIKGVINLNDNIDNLLDYTLVKVRQDSKDAHDNDESYRKLNYFCLLLRELSLPPSSINNEIDLPIFVYYSVERSNINKSTTALHEALRTQAYYGSLADITEINHVVDWFISMDRARTQKKTDFLSSDIPDDPEAIRKLQKELNSLSKEEAILRDTLGVLISDLQNLRVDRSSGKDLLVFDYHGNIVEIEQLSHGQRSIIYMVMDLVYRMFILNPHMEDPRQSKGIVVIDEIELHLHPDWQQNIIGNLRKLFPKIQFIITTHSPMVVRTVPQECLRYLSNDGNNQIKIDIPDKQSQGISFNEALTNIFGISQDVNIPITRELEKAYAFIAQNNFEAQQFEVLYKKLESHFGKDSITIQSVDSAIRLQRLKNRRKELEK